MNQDNGINGAEETNQPRPGLYLMVLLAGAAAMFLIALAFTVLELLGYL